MRALLATGAAVAALLVAAAPAVTITAEPAPHARPHVLPGLPDRPDEGCTLPAGVSLEPCRPPERLRPPTSCVLPVDLPPGTTLVSPECPRRDPSPEGRVVPVLPLSR